MVSLNNSNNMKHILVVRQESLKDDLIELETYLQHQRGRGNAPNRVRRNQSKLSQSDTIHYVNQANKNDILGYNIGQQQHRELVCCEILFDEIRIYHMFIQLSKNLNVNEKQKTITNIYKRCGFDDAATKATNAGNDLELQLRNLCQSKKG